MSSNFSHGPIAARLATSEPAPLFSAVTYTRTVPSRAGGVDHRPVRHDRQRHRLAELGAAESQLYVLIVAGRERDRGGGRGMRHGGHDGTAGGERGCGERPSPSARGCCHCGGPS